MIGIDSSIGRLLLLKATIQCWKVSNNSTSSSCCSCMCKIVIVGDVGCAGMGDVVVVVVAIRYNQTE
jgi:hypothetical protein